jgi:HD superfamily phosphodiesterase
LPLQESFAILRAMDWKAFIRTLFRLAEPYLAVRGDLPHARVSHQYALRLLEAEGGEPGIVEPAVILHDLGWSQLTPEQIRIAFGVRAGGEEAERLNRIHEREGASLARRLLQSLEYDPPRVDRIVEIIERHDSGRRADTLEERITKDADKLWRFSEIGFWNEIERQGLAAEELHRYLSERYGNWFFTSSALSLAEMELKARAAEPIFSGAPRRPAADTQEEGRFWVGKASASPEGD